MFKAKFGVRGSVLVIALVPSLALLSASIGTSVYLFDQGVNAEHWSSGISAASAGRDVVHAVERERQLSLLLMTGVRPDPAELAAVRSLIDSSLAAAVASAPAALKQHDSPQDMVNQVTTRLDAVRRGVDSGALTPQTVYDFYSQLVSYMLQLMVTLGNSAPVSATAMDSDRAQGVFYSLEALLRSSGMEAIGAVQRLDRAQFAEFGTQIGYYHTELGIAGPMLVPGSRAKLNAVMSSPAWQRLSALEGALLRRGTDEIGDSTDLAAVRARQQDIDEITKGIQVAWEEQITATEVSAAEAGDNTARNSLFGGVAAIGVAVLAFLVALLLTGRLISRLRRLREETLALADERLPQIVSMLGRGERPDLSVEVTKLEFGSDEIGEVADAFNRAQGAAIAAAVNEAETREGVKAVFLNIARRSQMVVHRQLEILDQAEYETEDPKQLEMLFQFDHLTTRERRNAENLIILGGEQPGRRWRSPVALVELVRSAVGETEDYARVQVSRMPELFIAGSVVADLIHLLAELVDNATSFSPPTSTVEITGNAVGRGVVVEVIDQGLGMTADEIARVNENLENPPDFSISDLSSDSRLGLFVVARLATRIDVSVRLIESDYSGICAIVRIPTHLIATDHLQIDSGGEANEAGQQPLRAQVAASDDMTAAGRAAFPPESMEKPPIMTAYTPADAELNPRRPSLPRRNKQTPPPSERVPAPTAVEGEELPERPRSAEHARDLLSAIEIGTRQGRHSQPGQAAAQIPRGEREERR